MRKLNPYSRRQIVRKALEKQAALGCEQTEVEFKKRAAENQQTEAERKQSHAL